LSAVALQPLVERIAEKLPTWMAGMMAKVGQLTMVRLVLAAIPLHKLVVLGISKKPLKQQVERIL
jgi:hypothetical protein